ncbi:response regulator [Coraliomargarita akajimensis]|uniref:Response regulator receiver protein n=1 Tax=Coraliomargarita akajimensis (strain DSM 45221 / IAM 15411 / JCM 23193 / KCTC 12865 / 04OKA010-24) TaxID=583355 RepID=D5EQB1_CORAD|nr:response regulator [Coraliomargarita akajimensis]ADE53879.1 response regulator receiver protein [Coraliomargarita akajimensis DSM 45221]
MSRPESALIVDDEPHLRIYLKLVLKQLGFTRFTEASNGQEAVDFYKERRPQLVLMDVNMPVKEGMEALKEIIDFDPDAVVVMASSVASRSAVEASVEIGASYYIRKDTPKEEILEILHRVITDIWGE